MSRRDNESDGTGYAIALGLLIVWALVYTFPSSPLHHRLVRWHEKPATYVAAAAVGAAHTLTERTAANVVAWLTNPLRPYAGLLLLLCLGLALYAPLTRTAGPFLDWQAWLHILCACFTGAVGLGTICGIPAAWPAVARIAGLAAGGVNFASACVCLVVGCSGGGDGRHKLRYGPSFVPPLARIADSIPVGRVDRNVIPSHARWIARRNGQIRIPYDRLSCGVTVIGEKGSGKSRLLFNFHDAIRARYPDVPILIHDPKGEWFRTYYDSGTDLFFAPHFKGSAAWALWSDFERVPELRHELLSTCVYAHQNREDTFWMDQALDLLDQASGFETVKRATDYLADIPHQNPDDKFLLSVFGTAKLGFLDLVKTEMMSAMAGAPARSIDDFLSWPGRIILLNNPACASEQKGAFSLFLSAFLLRALSLPDVPAGTLRAVAIVDEALTFNLPPEVDRRIHTMCRSKGVCLVTGAQRLPDRQRSERGEWHNAEYTFAMKCVDQDTQRELSKRAGSVHYQSMAKSTTTAPSQRAQGPSYTDSEHDMRHDAIPPEHFGRLAPREFTLFHDRGIVTGRTLDVPREQRDIALPAYDRRDDVRRISMQLMAKPKEGGTGGAGPSMR